jgi:hypothetical protein
VDHQRQRPQDIRSRGRRTPDVRIVGPENGEEFRITPLGILEVKLKDRAGKVPYWQAIGVSEKLLK